MALLFNSANSQIFETSLNQRTGQNANIPVHSYYNYSIYFASEFLPAVQGTSTVKLDVSSWSKGVFFAHINNANTFEIVKLIVQ